MIDKTHWYSHLLEEVTVWQEIVEFGDEIRFFGRQNSK